MPIYEFTCNECNDIFSVLVLSSNSDKSTCPKCGSEDTKKAMSSFSCSVGSGGMSGGAMDGFGGGGGG